MPRATRTLRFLPSVADRLPTAPPMPPLCRSSRAFRRRCEPVLEACSLALTAAGRSQRRCRSKRRRPPPRASSSRASSSLSLG